MSAAGRRDWPRTIWTYWHDWTDAPEVALLSATSWQSMNPGWELRRLDQASCEDLLGRETCADIFAKGLTRVDSADLLKIELLWRFGGVWADATTLCAQPLDEWLPGVMQAGYFAFRRPEPERPIATWFQAATPGGDLVQRLHAAHAVYWQDRASSDNYFWAHRVFALLTEKDETAAALWKGVPQRTAMHRLHFGPNATRLTEPLAQRDLALLRVPPAPVCKLTHKLQAAPDPGSLLDVLAQGFRRPAGPASRRLVLHIGLPKAASTTIQSWAEENRQALAARGIVYPRTDPRLDHPKHQELIWSLLRERHDLLDKLFYPHGGDTLFLSAEGLSVHLAEADPDRLAILRERLAQYEITLFINRRAPDSWLTSFHQQLVVNPSNGALPYATAFTRDKIRALPMVELMSDPDALAARAANAYGAREVIFGDLETDWAETLCKLLGVDDMAEELRASARRNTGLGPDATELVRQANSARPPEATRKFLISALRRVEHCSPPDPLSGQAWDWPPEFAELIETLKPKTDNQRALMEKLASYLSPETSA